MKHHAAEADEIWHAGDIGNPVVLDELEKIKPLNAVYGNIDGQEIRKRTKEFLRFNCEGADVLITHIANRPENYTAPVKQIMQTNPPQIIVCGHSHILLVKFSEKWNCLHINPGAAGINGFHQKRTMIRMKIDNGKPTGMEVIELGNRTAPKII